MNDQVYRPGPQPRTVQTGGGEVLAVPGDWVLLPPGDAALTRRVKAATEFWLVSEKRGRREFSQGLWATAAIIQQISADLQVERSTDAFAKRRVSQINRRERVQDAYVEDFTAAVTTFLGFHPCHANLAQQLAKAVADHATPVGSGTVARTERIPVQQRAEAAVIAWMRHQTTAYDAMVIPRVKGKRREVRRMLARRSAELLARYRRGETADSGCPLRRALDQ
jgi:hypothetical protein